jgi:hypothetical protein
MDSLLTWALWIIATAVEVSPGLALLMAGPIGRFLRRVLFVRGQGGGAVVANRSGSGSKAHADYHSPSCDASLRGRATLLEMPRTERLDLAAAHRRGPFQLPADEVAQLGAQLPILMRGLYYDQWHHPAGKPERLRHGEEFLAAVAAVLEHHIAPTR